MSEPMMVCANCGCALGDKYADSQLYSPDEDFSLCLPCDEIEEELVDSEGTNDIPYMIEKYRRVVRNELR